MMLSKLALTSDLCEHLCQQVCWNLLDIQPHTLILGWRMLVHRLLNEMQRLTLSQALYAAYAIYLKECLATPNMCVVLLLKQGT